MCIPVHGGIRCILLENRGTPRDAAGWAMRCAVRVPMPLGVFSHTRPNPVDSQSTPDDPEPPKETATVAVDDEEEATMREYWKEYVKWEQSFVNYHGRRPTKEEGAQDVPAEYRA